MTDNDIIKAIGCCISCSECSYEKYVNGCVMKRDDDVIDLINRQKAEIDDLKAKKKICAEVIARQDKEIENLSKAVDNYESCLKSVEVIRANAIKEFAEKLKSIDLYQCIEEYYKNAELCYEVRQDWFCEQIDNLVKEMAEKKE